MVEIFVYNRQECRIAGESVKEGDTANRERSAHITNGGLSKKSERALLHEEPELTKRNLQEKVQQFIAKTFAEHLNQDITRRVSISANEDDSAIQVKKFVVAGLDIMVTQDDRLYLLEVNVDPAAPSLNTVQGGFQDHLIDFMGDLMDLVVGKPSTNFISCKTILNPKT